DSAVLTFSGEPSTSNHVLISRETSAVASCLPTEERFTCRDGTQMFNAGQRDGMLKKQLPGQSLRTATRQTWQKSTTPVSTGRQEAMNVTVRLDSRIASQNQPILGTVSYAFGAVARVDIKPTPYVRYVAQLVSATPQNQEFLVQQRLTPVKSPMVSDLAFDSATMTLSISDLELAQIAKVDPATETQYYIYIQPTQKKTALEKIINIYPNPKGDLITRIDLSNLASRFSGKTIEFAISVLAQRTGSTIISDSNSDYKHVRSTIKFKK
ncbi:MAG: hypothetical protein K2X47_12525, partial [Bdellovibrionales bacterium]|nr:hypothetical protein [Bdellovibrionales bacterium]